MTKTMTEKQATKAYFDNKITKAKYHLILHEIEGKRHAKDISKKKHRASMSSSKWS
jgi:hypothetical protein